MSCLLKLLLVQYLCAQRFQTGNHRVNRCMACDSAALRGMGDLRRTKTSSETTTTEIEKISNTSYNYEKINHVTT